MESFAPLGPGLSGSLFARTGKSPLRRGGHGEANNRLERTQRGRAALKPQRTTKVYEKYERKLAVDSDAIVNRNFRVVRVFRGYPRRQAGLIGVYLRLIYLPDVGGSRRFGLR